MINYIHQQRVTAMRRVHTDRLCLLTSTVLVIYIAWNVLYPSDRHGALKSDLREQIAYAQAVNTSLPLIQNTQLCSLNQIDLLLTIISDSSHFLQRQAVRETWTSMPEIFGVRSQRLFVLGYHPNGNFYKDLASEAAHEQDLLYLTANDYDATLKEVHAYQWLERHCPNVTYMFKTEDDLFVNTFLLHELIRELKSEPNDVNNRHLYTAQLDSFFAAQKTDQGRQFLFGLAYQPGRPERNLTASPFFVTQEEYANELYPRYCSGFGYLMNSATRSVLSAEALKDKRPFRFAAIYLTGIVPERLNFVCQLFPFGVYQGSVDDCAQLIKNTTTKSPPPSTSPLLTCSTGLHLGQNAFTDYYRLWTDLKHVYADRVEAIREA